MFFVILCVFNKLSHDGNFNMFSIIFFFTFPYQYLNWVGVLTIVRKPENVYIILKMFPYPKHLTKQNVIVVCFFRLS